MIKLNKFAFKTNTCLSYKKYIQFKFNLLHFLEFLLSRYNFEKLVSKPKN